MKTFEEVHVGFQKTYNYETNDYKQTSSRS